MISRLLAASRLVGPVRSKLNPHDRSQLQNLVSKRWSGHNQMDITPSNWEWMKMKDILLLYFSIGTIPLAVFFTIVNIRANPELTEIPEGYEPREWEYYKNPVTRFLARYIYAPQEADEEMIMDAYDIDSENLIMIRMQKRVERVMAFYNDHRSRYFIPYFGEYYRRARDEREYLEKMYIMMGSEVVDAAYNPDRPIVPIDGYKPSDFQDSK